VPDHAWENYLENRDAPAAYWRIPCADHYLQVDTPDLIADIMRTSSTATQIDVETEAYPKILQCDTE
jgi:hypothetical protein